MLQRLADFWQKLILTRNGRWDSLRQPSKDCFNSAQPEREAAAAVLVALARHDAASNRALGRAFSRVSSYSLPEGGRPEARAASNRALRRERLV